jgi:hypothetical protein
MQALPHILQLKPQGSKALRIAVYVHPFDFTLRDASAHRAHARITNWTGAVVENNVRRTRWLMDGRCGYG